MKYSNKELVEFMKQGAIVKVSNIVKDIHGSWESGSYCKCVDGMWYYKTIGRNSEWSLNTLNGKPLTIEEFNNAPELYSIIEVNFTETMKTDIDKLLSE